MTFKSKKFWAGPLFVSLVFGLFYYNQKLISHKQLDQINRAFGFILIDSTEELNLKHKHGFSLTHPNYKNVAPWVASMGAGVTVADFNGDGYQDVILNDSSPEHHDTLYINNQKGKFEDKTREFKLDQLKNNLSHTKIIAFDCNNDGFPDLFIFPSNCPSLLINRGGKYFEDYTKQSGIGGCSSPGVAANAFDYDKDGNLDLIWGSYFSNDPFYQGEKSEGLIPDNFNDSKNASTIFLKRNDGQCHFEDKSHLLSKIVHQRGWHIDIGIADIFQKGNQDLWLATDYGITHPQRFISAEKGWKDESELVDKPTKTRNSMGVILSDLEHKGVNNIFLPNIFRWREKINGNLLWEYDPTSNEFKEKARQNNVQACGWTWGSQFIDLNNDTWDDLVITNGMFGDGHIKKNYWYSLSVLDASGRDFMGNVKNWPDMTQTDLDGGLQDCIFLNLGKGRGFADISTKTVFDQDKKNGRGIAYIDVNNNGIYSLIVANQGDFSHAYTVNPTEPFNWIGIDLRGLNHNSFAWGAKIFWKLSDGSQGFKEMRPIQGYIAQNDPRFRFAYPTHLSLVELSIQWLDGKTQKLDLNKLNFNHYNIIERIKK